MARYGYGYTVDGLIAGIKKGLEEAIEPTAKEMLEEIRAKREQKEKSS